MQVLLMRVVLFGDLSELKSSFVFEYFIQLFTSVRLLFAVGHIGSYHRSRGV